MKRLMVAILLALVLLGTMSLVACAPTEIRTNTFSVGASPAVNLEVGNGNVSLVVAQEGEIIVTAELRKPDSIEYNISQDGDLITVEIKTRSGSRADVTVTLPRNTEFNISSGNGNIEVTDVQAPGIVNHGNGDITLNDVTGQFIFNNGNGDITVNNATGSFLFNNGNGNIRLQGELVCDSSSVINIGNGSVTVELSGSPSVALDLEIQESGNIIVDLPVTVSEQSDYNLIGTIGNGEALLEVNIGNGDITVK